MRKPYVQKPQAEEVLCEKIGLWVPDVTVDLLQLVIQMFFWLEREIPFHLVCAVFMR